MNESAQKYLVREDWHLYCSLGNRQVRRSQTQVRGGVMADQRFPPVCGRIESQLGGWQHATLAAMTRSPSGPRPLQAAQAPLRWAVAGSFNARTVASAMDSMALGNGAIASAQAATAVGVDTRATGSMSSAFGPSARAINTNAAPLGVGSVTSGENSRRARWLLHRYARQHGSGWRCNLAAHYHEHGGRHGKYRRAANVGQLRV